MGPLMNDVLGGQVQLAVVAVAPAAAHIKSGALRALAVVTPRATKSSSPLRSQQPRSFDPRWRAWRRS